MSPHGPPPSDDSPKLDLTEPEHATPDHPPGAAAPAPLFQPGQRVPNRPIWTLVKEIGRGGFGEVWQAKHEWKKNLFCAVKFCTHPEAPQLVTHEKKVIVRVMTHAGDHPHIVPLIDYDIDGGVPWLMYEYVEGGTLIDAVGQWRNLPLPKRLGRVVMALYGLSRALKRVHRLDPPIVHRDLKPANILMARGVPKITDFGISAAAATAKANDTGRMPEVSIRLPSMLETMGTMRYAPQEQFLGSPPSPRDDVYALGVIAFQMITGDLKAVPGTDAADILAGFHVPPELITLIVRSVAMDPLRRPETAREWERALRQWMPKRPKPGEKLGATVVGTNPNLPSLSARTSEGSPKGFTARPVPSDPQPMTSSAKPPTTAPPGATAPPPSEVSDVPDEPPGPLTLLLNVPGVLLSRPDAEPDAIWKEVDKLPATVTLALESAYSIRIKETAADADVAGLAALARRPMLVGLNLAWCEQITDAGLAYLKDLRGLQSLELMGCKRVTNFGTVHLAKLKRLKSLNLRWCVLLTDMGLQVMRKLGDLETLDLMGCGNLTDGGMLHLRVLTKLKSLNLRWCDKLTDSGLKHLETLTNLRYLNLWNCTQITDAGVAAFKTANPACHIER
jgi:serine/threonine protein kinase